MNEITLTEFVKTHGQTETAKRLGVSQGAVWQMLKKKRQIMVIVDGSGVVRAYEKKPIGNAGAA